MMILRKLSLLLSVMLLASCAANPDSYLPKGSKPIINIEANVDSLVDVEASSEELLVTNKIEQSVQLSYKLFWYDKHGVTQHFSADDGVPWQMLWLAPNQKHKVFLEKPTAESEKYRFYLRGEARPLYHK